MQTSFDWTRLPRLRNWFVGVWRMVSSSIGDPVDRLVGRAQWEDKPARKPRVLSR